MIIIPEEALYVDCLQKSHDGHVTLVQDPVYSDAQKVFRIEFLLNFYCHLNV